MVSAPRLSNLQQQRHRSACGDWVLMHGQVQMDLQRAKVHIECNKHELQKFMSLMIGAQKRQASNNLLIETQFQKMQKRP